MPTRPGDDKILFSQVQRTPKMPASVMKAIAEQVQGSTWDTLTTPAAREREIAPVREFWRALMSDADAVLAEEGDAA